MKQTVSFNDFCDAWRSHDRNDSFSYEGKKALFEWIEEIEEDCDSETELDIIALDCEFSEHASAYSCVYELGYDDFAGCDDAENKENNEEKALEYLENQTLLIRFEGGIIIQGF
tara:strand:+ start:72 stop:413 length:342 start_codon:yes stop_codon:yes gene_type:complete